ncbi:Aromatic-ring hydroxylase (flavoprotein monooxygenase) [Gracilaria domingensis]|nr:Aromatic-ring hydroxylase (flavoprotein monooxygenase) [Gracilaria domingensis]
MGVADQFLRIGHKLYGFVFNVQGQSARPKLDFHHLDTPFPFILTLSQTETERILLHHLSDEYGVQIEWNTELMQLVAGADEESYSAFIRHADGTQQTSAAKWIIGCDGMGSVVRREAGLEFDGDMYEGTVMQLMDAPVSGFEWAEDAVHYYMSKERFLLLARLPNDLYRVIVSFKGTIDDNDKDKARELFQDVIESLVEDVQLGEPKWVSKWRVWKKQATKYMHRNVILVGDSAHVHSPSGGQGMNCGMQDAYNVGWKLAMRAEADRGTGDRRNGRDPQHPHGARQTAGASHEGDATGRVAQRRRAPHLRSELPLRRRERGGRDGAAGARAARAGRGAAQRAAARPDRRRAVHAAAGARGGDGVRGAGARRARRAAGAAARGGGGRRRRRGRAGGPRRARRARRARQAAARRRRRGAADPARRLCRGARRAAQRARAAASTRGRGQLCKRVSRFGATNGGVPTVGASARGRAKDARRVLRLLRAAQPRVAMGVAGAALLCCVSRRARCRRFQNAPWRVPWLSAQCKLEFPTWKARREVQRRHPVVHHALAALFDPAPQLAANVRRSSPAPAHLLAEADRHRFCQA